MAVEELEEISLLGEIPENNVITINGSSAKDDENLEIAYGTNLSISIPGVEEVVEYYYTPMDDRDADPVKMPSVCELEPGTYIINYDYTDIHGDSHYSDGGFKFTVVTAKMQAPENLSFDGYEITWSRPVKTESGFDDGDNNIKSVVDIYAAD